MTPVGQWECLKWLQYCVTYVKLLMKSQVSQVIKIVWPNTPDSEIVTLELMLDFLSGIVYFHGMNFYTHKMKFGLSGIVVLVFYLISLVLTPLFHQHPGEYHPGSINTGYHSHAEPFVTHTSEHGEDDNREDAIPHHFGETITPFEDMVGVVQVNPGNIINPAKVSLIFDIFIPTSSESCPNQLYWQHGFNLLPHQPQQDYSIFTATDLSPPQA